MSRFRRQRVPGSIVLDADVDAARPMVPVRTSEGHCRAADGRPRGRSPLASEIGPGSGRQVRLLDGGQQGCAELRRPLDLRAVRGSVDDHLGDGSTGCGVAVSGPLGSARSRAAAGPPPLLANPAPPRWSPDRRGRNERCPRRSDHPSRGSSGSVASGPHRAGRRAGSRRRRGRSRGHRGCRRSAAGRCHRSPAGRSRSGGRPPAGPAWSAARTRRPRRCRGRTRPVPRCACPPRAW
jgi:hypothetical protein